LQFCIWCHPLNPRWARQRSITQTILYLITSQPSKGARNSPDLDHPPVGARTPLHILAWGGLTLSGRQSVSPRFPLNLHRNRHKSSVCPHSPTVPCESAVPAAHRAPPNAKYGTSNQKESPRLTNSGRNKRQKASKKGPVQPEINASRVNQEWRNAAPRT